MNRREVAALLAYAAKLDPRSAPTDESAAAETLDQWADLLADVPPAAPHPTGRAWDAAQVVRHHIATSPYPIKPSDVSRPWHAFRRDVVDRHHDPVPAVDPDDPEAYRAALVATRHAVATGTAPAATYRELTGGTREEREQAAAERLAALGDYVPTTVRDALAPYRPRQAERERLATADLPDPLDVTCPYEQCRARAGTPCVNRRRHPRRTAHPSRLDLATARRYAQESAA
ncbi:cell surface glycoprotein [Streptomyces albofaciens JCM 4342]|uniref:zinc finger domain-containing protein n=1 Tax=Streptomyces albofaciens TaxID=66866 RepID=UPI00123AF7DE|nr:cell surface glycoprotein [Streptomyces albofaciens]KAA6215125.1 cell surface glycoprotein [Streptomyces albofaciens JCM 4342]KAA6220624.1 cell surface glycoprotein [Streptomyces albofaciens JCM 4342]